MINSLRQAPHAKIDGGNSWAFIGIATSLALHAGVAIAYFWTPKHNYVPPPSAAPIVVSIVAPLSAPNKKTNDLPPAPDQQATIAQAPTAIEPPASEQKVARDKPRLIVPQTDRPSQFKSIEKPPTKEVSTKPIKVPKPKLAVVKTKAKPKRINETHESQSIAKQATAMPTVDVNKQSLQVTALQTGQLSEQGKMARLNWQKILHAHLEREKRYPRKAKRMRKQGMPIITFTLDRKGNVLGVSLVKSSGTASLDSEALDLPYRAQPLPVPPRRISDKELTLTLPINFSM